MRGITYKNTKSSVPGYANFHIDYPCGYAYETNIHFVHIYGTSDALSAINLAFTVIQKKSGDLNNWVINIFGAQDIKPLKLEVGHAINGVWRPALYNYENIF